MDTALRGPADDERHGSARLDGKNNKPKLKTLRHKKCVFRRQIPAESNRDTEWASGSGAERDRSEPASAQVPAPRAPLYSPK